MVLPKLIVDLTNDNKRLTCSKCKRKSNMLCKSLCMACYAEKFGHMPWDNSGENNADRKSTENF